MSFSIHEGWKQIAPRIGYSVRQTYRHYLQVKERLKPLLRHYLGEGHRMRMDDEDVAHFKNLILQAEVLRPASRGPAPRIMAENGMICQTRLFD